MFAASPSRLNASKLRALQYFEAVARHNSVKLAAAELGVSQSAVSHQLRELTKMLGEKLLLRSGRGIALSPKGQELAGKLSNTFASLQSSFDEIVGSGRLLLRLAVCSSFGPSWLIPRMRDFIAANPQIDLQLQLYTQDPLLTDQVADMIISARPAEPGYTAVHIIDEMLVAVRRPGKAEAKYRLITTDVEPNEPGRDWLKFCENAKLRLSDIQSGAWLQCTHYLLALEMARAGLGLALVPDFLAKRDIDTGALSDFERTRMPSGRAYHLCYKHSRSNEPGIRIFAHWLRAKLNSVPVINIAARRPV